MTLLFAFIVTLQVVPDTESQPVHPLKRERNAGAAVSVTTVPLLKSAEQLDPQSIPPGLEVTVPPRRPVFVTVNVTLTANTSALVAVPLGVVTLKGPVVAPAGTVARIWVAEITVNAAAVPLSRTDVAPVKLVPLIVTLAPTSPLVGVKLVMAGTTVKFVALVAVPPGVVRLIGPVVAPAGTIA